MNPKVSIIVPIFNMEHYLDRCMESLLGQSLTDIEIIAVNDGSNDSSLSILEEYAQKDSRLKIINKENGGVSAARNEGVKAARGQYIGFVDPDDWVNSSMYEAMYQAVVQEDADIVMCTYIREFGTHSKEKTFELPHKQTYRRDDVQAKMLRRLVGPLKEELANPEYLDAWGTVWSKLYRAELLKDNHLKFMDLNVIGSNEDTLFNIHAFYYAKSFIFLNRPYYHYWRANEASITSTHNPMLAEKFDKLYSSILSFITEKQLPNEYKTALNNRICMNVLGLGLNIMSEDKPAAIRKKLRSLNLLLRSNRMRQSLKTFEMSYCPLVWRAFFFCAKIRFSLVIYLMLTAINWMRKRNTGRLNVDNGTNIASGNHNESRRLRNHAHELLPSNGSKENTV
ncbi:glycosyltransferase family 2 protein [Paenibacillus prosopidis]|uniref:Glycosyltransferase EpsH n=1 Tax=Paenibacillus prosopidis TaxID=630520 RepID=A0A368VP33_9BACL|nr:glycosyltransferase [Paenibacillus prosopidis]RCW42735.1 glycosyltransferase EpsH [Paenibacillus prosopidis]